MRGESEHDASEIPVVEDETETHQGDTHQKRIDHHCLEVELRGLLCSGAYAHYADAYQLYDLARPHRAENLESREKIYDELRDSVVGDNREIHHNLDYEENIDAASEIVVHLLLFLGLFKCHIKDI